MGIERQARRSTPTDPADPHFPGWGIHSGAVGLRGSREGARVRLGRRGVALFLVGALFLAVLAGLVALRFLYMPLGQGSAIGPGPTMFVGTAEAGSGKVWEYCFAPDATFAWHISLRNNGPLPVIILGAGRDPMSDPTQEPFTLRDLAAYRLATSSGATDPATAPVLAPRTVPAGAELELWARFHTGAMAPGATWAGGIWVRFSTLGVERTAEVPLTDGVGVEAAPCQSP